MKDYTELSVKLAKVLFGRRFLKLGIIAEGPDYDAIEKEVAGELEHIMGVCYRDGETGVGSPPERGEDTK